MRKIAVVTGTRAEYGALYPVLKAIEAYVVGTEDFTKGTTAFLEKRKPTYKAK